MFGWKEHRAAIQARRLYELSRIESLIAANRAVLDAHEARQAEGCRLCAEAAKQA